MAGKTFFDQEALIRDMVQGRLTLRQIADKHSLSLEIVSSIHRGRRRPELKARIDAVRQAALKEAHRVVDPDLVPLLDAEAQAGQTGKGLNAHKCRRYLLDRFLPNEDGTWPEREP